MGNSQSNSINDQVNQILQESPASSPKSNTPVDIKFSEAPPKFVNPETDAPKVVKSATKSAASTNLPPPVGLFSPTTTEPKKEAPKSPKASDAPKATQSVGLFSNQKSETAVSATSSATVPKGVELSATSSVSSDMPSKSDAPSVVFPKRSSKKGKNCESATINLIVLSPELFKTPASPASPPSPKSPVLEVAPKKGGYSYQLEASELDNNMEYRGGDDEKKVVSLDNSLFETSELSGGEEDNKKSSDFNPEQFFKDMQTGGVREPRNKQYKKGKIERYLDPEGEEDNGFDFAASTEGLEIDENEDTEDIKQKVKALRAMVSRSKGKKGKKGSKKAKRATESSSVGGATENSVSEYLNSTSSISTSDVRLISMNKMRK
jgi:hypothetical protein